MAATIAEPNTDLFCAVDPECSFEPPPCVFAHRSSSPNRAACTRSVPRVSPIPLRVMSPRPVRCQCLRRSNSTCGHRETHRVARGRRGKPFRDGVIQDRRRSDAVPSSRAAARKRSRAMPQATPATSRGKENKQPRSSYADGAEAGRPCQACISRVSGSRLLIPGVRPPWRSGPRASRYRP